MVSKIYFRPKLPPSRNSPLSIGIITSKHYLSECNKNGGGSGTSGGNEDEQKLMGLHSDPGPCPLTSSKSEVIGSFIGMGIVGFCFGIGLMLAVKTVNNLEELIRR